MPPPSLYQPAIDAIAAAVATEATAGDTRTSATRRPGAITLPTATSPKEEAKQTLFVHAYAWITFPRTTENVSEWQQDLTALVASARPLTTDSDVQELVKVLRRNNHFNVAWRLAQSS